MILAQALGEYAALSALASAASSAWLSAETFIRNVEPATWVFVGLGIATLWAVWGRFR